MNTPQNFPQISSLDYGSLMMFGLGGLGLIFVFVIMTMIVPLCLIFKKAGRQWWEAIIPIYNAYIMTKIVGLPWWILFGFFVPIINWVISVVMYYYLSKRFGFDILFTLGLVFLPFIFLPILGFGGALYTSSEIIKENI
jgi:hypothetical protein